MQYAPQRKCWVFENRAEETNPNYGHQFIRKSKPAAAAATTKSENDNQIGNIINCCGWQLASLAEAMKVKTNYNSGCHKCHIDQQTKYNKSCNNNNSKG